MSSDPKFITDASLGGLARWLRLVGFDSLVYGSEAGRQMMRQAQMQQRILLTRRRDLLERQFAGEMLLLPEGHVSSQLCFVIHKLSLEITEKKMYTRCLGCNETLDPIEKADVRELVPQFVYETCDHFNQCKRCRKVYWPGSHARNALGFLEKNKITIHMD